MKTLRALLITIAATILTAGIQPAHAQQPAAKPAAPRSAAPAGPVFNHALLHPALLKAKAPDVFKARFTTTRGDFVVEVHRDWAPLGADRFYNLVKNGYFNNASFFRVVYGFVAQFGLSPVPAVNTAWQHTEISDDPVKQTNAEGTLTFASRGPNTRTTQLFINLANNSRLDGMGFSPFGKVVEGMDVVQKFYSGYGESPDQGQITSVGRPYLDKNFPDLDRIRLARVEVGAAPVHPVVKKPAVPAASK
jgi:peptidyl-prolyl cis-trans isomerase A (cyclophilin A)